MNGAVAPAEIAISISIGASLLAGFLPVWVAVRSPRDAAASRDTTVSILFGAAFLLTLLYVIAGTLIAARGMAYLGLLKAALLLTAVFAGTGMVFSLMRTLRRGRAIKTPSA
jgi:hypothetical protein